MDLERNLEIWSTRLQRELLALTTDNAPVDTKEEVVAVLPPFVTIAGHALVIEKGDCILSFTVDLPAKAEEKKIVVTLDASLQKKADGSVDPAAAVYPFLKPVAMLQSGGSRFPEGSTIKDGDLIDIEMDWTPSLHLTDSILNIALKIKESILQGEPFHAAATKGKSDVVEGMVTRAKQLGTSFTKGLRGQGGRRKKKKDRKSAQKANPSKIRIGDEINMLEAPWVECQGVYSCKAIRRPAFVEEAIAVAAKSSEARAKDQVRPFAVSEDGDGKVPSNLGDFMLSQAGTVAQAASASFGGAGAVLRTISQSARSVLEESFLMITESHIIELRSNKLNLSTGVITFAIPIETLAKLKFRRQESISLFYKPAPDDPLIYMCPDSSDCVQQIQQVLRRHGVKGKHTNAATHRAINQALHLVQEIQTKELALKHDPSVERVNEIMDLYRQAAERFENAGDVRHEEVVIHMRKFLALPLTVSILDGSYVKSSEDLPISREGEGLVLESERSAARSDSDDKAFEQNMEEILKEAEADLAKLKLEADPEFDIAFEETSVSGHVDDDADDAIADFENMLKEADNELEELMKS